MHANRFRRGILWCAAWSVAAGAQPLPARSTPSSAEEWLEEARSSRALEAPLRLSRFVEPIYYVLEPGIVWTPNPDNAAKYTKVRVPQGFITDLASIPPILFPILRADGEYAQAAIVHDYLYWTQRTTRAEADDVFRVAMRDLEVSPFQTQTIFQAVRRFGQLSWDDNAKMKKAGERRFLKRFPSRAATRWADWKLDPNNFHPQDL